MKLKTVEVNGKTYAEVTDGRPVYVEDDGKEVAFDAPGTRATITRLNGEAKTHREAKEALEDKVKAFEGIEDPAAARKALETIKNIDDKKLVDAGKVEEIKSAVAKGYQDQITSLTKAHADELGKVTGERDTVRNQFHSSMVAQAFASSKLIADKFTIPADLAQAKFGAQFKVEDGKIVAYDGNNQPVYSRASPGNPPSFDEALEIIVSAYPHKDHILKGAGGGSGAKPGSSGGEKTMTRSQFEALSPVERAQKMKDKYAVVDG